MRAVLYVLLELLLLRLVLGKLLGEEIVELLVGPVLVGLRLLEPVLLARQFVRSNQRLYRLIVSVVEVLELASVLVIS